jgi:hypothetical protein
MGLPRSLILFTDGQGSFDIALTSQKLRSAGVELQVTEAVGLNKESALKKLALELGGKYERV